MDMNWLSDEALKIHGLFSSMFYSIVLLMIVSGVVISFFKMPMGQVPEVLQLVGRAILAAFILAAFPEIMNTLANITDDVAKNVGQLNNFKLVVSRLGEKIGTLSWSWVSVKDSVLLIISYLTFFVVYISVYVADAMYLLTWTMLFVFSPILIAAFTLPSFASATKGLFQSIIEVCLWKICWSIQAALLWSFALSQINSPKYDVDFLTAIVLNLMLAFSVLLTPMIVKALIKGGMSGTVSGLGGTLLATAALTPTGLIGMARSGGNLAMSKLRGEQDDKTEPRRAGTDRSI